MSKGLEALHHPRIKSAKVDISAEGKHGIAYMFFGDTKQYAAIEKELKEHEQYKDIEVRLGVDLIKYLKLQLDGGYFKVPDRVVEEFCTSFKPNEVVGRIPDKVSQEGIILTYYDKWDDTCEPIEYLYSWANEGVTWALTREELGK